MTRFTERVTRDLDQIADRATPSPTAWESIQHRIDEQTDQPTMEVIMLSPDRNDSPKRGWMLAAAAGVIVLIGGLVFATTRSGDDTVPADTPQATLPAEPAPQAVVDPDAEAVVVPAPEPTAAAEVAPEPEPVSEAVTVTVTSTSSDGVVAPTTTPSASGLVGDASIQLVTTYEGDFAGTAETIAQIWFPDDGSTFGSGEFLFTGSIEGLGSGTLTMVDRWQIVDDVWSGRMTIIGGTGDFEGAYGGATSVPDPNDPSGGNGTLDTWTITVPPAGSLVSVTANGTATDPDFAVEPTDVDGVLTYGATTAMSGDIEGAAPHTGTMWLSETSALGTGDFEFNGTIAGLGTGTMTFTDIWALKDGATSYAVFVTGGTGDFEGITGTGAFIDEGDVDPYEFVLTAPIGR